jgi:chromosome segregation ATPase
VAISTGCGQLDSFLVDNARTAQECIKILKEQQLGVATFITLVSAYSHHFSRFLHSPSRWEALSTLSHLSFPLWYICLSS